MLVRIALDGIVSIPALNISPTLRTAIVGDNGSGKTQILSSLHIAAGGDIPFPSSFREKSFSVGFGSIRDDRAYDFRFVREDSKKICFLQSQKITGTKYLEALPFRTVMFSPFDMNLLYFAPGPRRDMMDSILKRTYAQFTGVKRTYEEILKQRNALLKQIREGIMKAKDLEFWDKKFAESSYTYMLYRRKWIDYIESHISEFLSAFPKYTIHFEYRSHVPIFSSEEDIYALLQEKQERDILIGHTTFGPHLDDFTFMILEGENQYEAPLFLSRGENKVLLLVLKYLEVQFIGETTKKEVVLLFDDLFAELDERHIFEVLEKFEEYMIIFTTQRLFPGLEKIKDFTCIKLNHP